MKKLIYFAAFAALALTSCAEKIETAPEATSKKIVFESPILTPATRSTGIDGGYTELPDSVGFTVYGKWNNTTNPYTNWKTAGNVYMGTDAGAGVGVTYSESNLGNGLKDWVPATDYYWPPTGSLNFLAYAPTGSTGASFGDTGVKFDSYFVNGSLTQDDLLFSDVTTNQSINNANSEKTNGVMMKFNHALAKVSLSAKALAEYNATIKVTDITLTLKKTGSFDQGLREAEGDVTGTPAWTPKTDETNSAYANVAATKADVAINHTAATNYSPILVLPQGFNENTKIKVTYSIKMGSNANGLETTKTVEKSLASLLTVGEGDGANTVAGFEIGKNYKINLIIGLNKIWFNAEVKDWADVAVNDVEFDLN